MIPLTVEEFFARSGVTHYKKGETILRGGDQPQGVFYIKKGYVRLYSLSKEGEELTLIIFKPGDFFPMIWAINNTSNMYYLESMTPVEVYRAPRDEFVSYIKGEPELKEFSAFFLVLVVVIIFTFHYGKKHRHIKSKIGKHEKFYGVREK
mgnify:CR=1 FL=1